MTQMTDARKVELYGELVNYICEALRDLDDIRQTLRNIGFTDEELKEEELYYDEDIEDNDE